MPQSMPTLCGSIMGTPFSLSANIHHAARAEPGLDYTFVCLGGEDPIAAVAAIRALCEVTALQADRTLHRPCAHRHDGEAMRQEIQRLKL